MSTLRPNRAAANIFTTPAQESGCRKVASCNKLGCCCITSKVFFTTSMLEVHEWMAIFLDNLVRYYYEKW